MARRMGSPGLWSCGHGFDESVALPRHRLNELRTCELNQSVLDGSDVLTGATRAERAVGGAVIRLSKAAVWTSAVEILGGLGVLIPRWRRAAAAILVALMIGALCTHAVHGEFPRLVPPLVLGGLAFLLYSSRLRP